MKKFCKTIAKLALVGLLGLFAACSDGGDEPSNPGKPSILDENTPRNEIIITAEDAEIGIKLKISNIPYGKENGLHLIYDGESDSNYIYHNDFNSEDYEIEFPFVEKGKTYTFACSLKEDGEETFSVPVTYTANNGSDELRLTKENIPYTYTNGRFRIDPSKAEDRIEYINDKYDLNIYNYRLVLEPWDNNEYKNWLTQYTDTDTINFNNLTRECGVTLQELKNRLLGKEKIFIDTYYFVKYKGKDLRLHFNAKGSDKNGLIVLNTKNIEGPISQRTTLPASKGANELAGKTYKSKYDNITYEFGDSAVLETKFPFVTKYSYSFDADIGLLYLKAESITFPFVGIAKNMDELYGLFAALSPEDAITKDYYKKIERDIFNTVEIKNCYVKYNGDVVIGNCFDGFVPDDEFSYSINYYHNITLGKYEISWDNESIDLVYDKTKKTFKGDGIEGSWSNEILPIKTYKEYEEGWVDYDEVTGYIKVTFTELPYELRKSPYYLETNTEYKFSYNLNEEEYEEEH